MVRTERNLFVYEIIQSRDNVGFDQDGKKW